MPATIAIQKIVEECTLTEDDDGIKYVEPYLVDNLDPTSASPLYDALNAPGMPQWSDGHGYIPGITVRSRIPKPFAKNSKTQARVTIEYRPPDWGSALENQPIIRFRAFTKEVTTSKLVGADPFSSLSTFSNPGVIRVKYNLTSAPNSAVPDQIGQTTMPKAMGVIEYDFIRNTDPTSLLQFHNKISSAPWRGQRKYTWMSIDLGIEKQKYRSGYHVHFAALYDEETHIKTVFYRDAAGNIPENIILPIDPYVVEPTEAPYGWRNVAPCAEKDFNLMGLPSVF